MPQRRQERPPLTVNRGFMTALLHAEPAVFALGLVEIKGQKRGFLALHPAELSHMTPQIVSPHGPDQYFHAERLAKFGLAHLISKHKATTADISHALETAIKNGYAYTRGLNICAFEKASSMTEAVT